MGTLLICGAYEPTSHDLLIRGTRLLSVGFCVEGDCCSTLWDESYDARVRHMIITLWDKTRPTCASHDYYFVGSTCASHDAYFVGFDSFHTCVALPILCGIHMHHMTITLWDPHVHHMTITLWDTTRPTCASQE